MDGNDEETMSPSKPKWFTPLRLLCIFCFTNLMVYLDRGLIASNGVNGSPRTADAPKGSGIQKVYSVDCRGEHQQLAFLAGLLVASPIFSEACKHYSAFRLIGIGMGTWTLATFGCGLAVGFWSLIVCRMLVGVGEASFVALAAPFIDDYAPAEHKARWFATFYLCIPVGFAAGYIFGGVVAAALGWRAAFFIESAVMVPFVAFAFLSKPLHLAGSRETGPDPAAPKSVKDVTVELAQDAKKVASHSVWLHMLVAYILYTAVLGVYAFWGPKAGKRIYNMKDETADVVFGAVTVVTGIVGSLFGGWLLDYLGSTLANANMVCGVGNWLGLMLVLPAFLAAKNFGVFIALFAAAELALFTMQAPVGAIGMWSVPQALRPLAISLVTVFIHLCGDVPSPPLVGAIQTALEAGKPPAEAAQQWRITMSIISLLLFFSGAVFLKGSRAARSAKDYRKQEELAAVAAVAEHHTPHLPNLHFDRHSRSRRTGSELGVHEQEQGVVLGPDLRTSAGSSEARKKRGTSGGSGGGVFGSVGSGGGSVAVVLGDDNEPLAPLLAADHDAAEAGGSPAAEEGVTDTAAG
eukprot:gene10079-10234_t